MLTWNLPPGFLHTLFAELRQDVHGRQFATWQEWRRYNSLINTPLVLRAGSLLLRAAGLSAEPEEIAAGVPGAAAQWQTAVDALCLTDALVDLSDDLGRGHVPLPQEALEEAGVRRTDLPARRSRKWCAAWSTAPAHGWTGHRCHRCCTRQSASRSAPTPTCTGCGSRSRPTPPPRWCTAARHCHGAPGCACCCPPGHGPRRPGACFPSPSGPARCRNPHRPTRPKGSAGPSRCARSPPSDARSSLRHPTRPAPARPSCPPRPCRTTSRSSWTATAAGPPPAACPAPTATGRAPTR
ncbi:squalene/phytoene synthase family protein [Streptomyces cellostaticus]|uniref:squalene/phytoene synthase family protein n=1 Tax=Streptomyces cellostaticus TaxID=67285 RepID=UPI000D14D7FF